MNSHSVDAHRVGGFFGVPQAPCLTTIPVKSASFTVTRIVRDIVEGRTVDVHLPTCDAYFLMLYLEDAEHSDIRADGSRLPMRRYDRGSICLVDLRNGASICLHSRLCALAFVLPRSLFDEVAALSSSTKLHRLRCRRGEQDAVLGNLAIALLPLLDGSHQSPHALLQYMATALCAHLLHTYSDESLRNGLAESALSIWQEKAAKEYMLDNLSTDLSVVDIARVTGLSANHFSHEFKKATGFTPCQWLTRMRVDRAKDLLSQPTLNLKTIAQLCGFADQSHFTKVFSRGAGTTPTAWRNARLH